MEAFWLDRLASNFTDPIRARFNFPERTPYIEQPGLEFMQYRGITSIFLERIRGHIGVRVIACEIPNRRRFPVCRILRIWLSE